MRKYLLLFILSAMLVSCGNKKGASPESSSVINKKKMAIVLVDVYLAESALLITSQEGKNTKAYTILYYNYIFEKNEITRGQYIKSIRYYSFHLKEMKEVYNDVINKLVVLHKQHRINKNSEE
ncbi:MAG: DUF4296 domain-containing protein [Bacteroidota bacterium]